MSEELDPFTQEPPSADVYSDKGASLDPKPAPEPESYDGSHEGLRELAEQRSSEERPVVDRYFLDSETGEQAAPDRPVGIKHASEALTARREAEGQEIDQAFNEAMATAVDDFRGQQPVQPQQPELGQLQPQELQPQAETSEPLTPELDALLSALPAEQRAPFLNSYNDLVQQASHAAASEYQAAVAQVQAVVAQNEQAAANAMLRGEALLLSQAPEIASVPREQRLLALDILEKQNPQRAMQIRELDRRIGAHLAAESQYVQAAQQRQVQAREQQMAQVTQAFQEYGAKEDAKVDKLLSSETPERRFAITQEAVQILREDGLTDAQIGFMWQNDFTFRSATAQKMLLREAKARIAQRGVRTQRATPIPHVVRPGSGEDAVDRSAYAEVSREFRGKDLSVKDATRLLLAKRASR